MSSFWPLPGRPGGFSKIGGLSHRHRIDKYRFVRIFGPIRKYIRTLPIAKAYDGMRQRKLGSFQYKIIVKMSVTYQNAILVQASCTCLALSSVHSVSIQKHVSLFV